MNLPAVVVCHGYLANSGFVSVPWAADLASLGLVSLFLDRRGHGRSGGSWRPPNTRSDQPASLEDAHLDVEAAIDYLRGRAPLVDPARIALVGHSDGGTAAMVAAARDWDVAATVSLSASLAPWEYVNHVAPRNLLLLYGADDAFVLQRTDVSLIKSATRGYLDGAGEVGERGDGSARRLVRVEGSGHVDLLYSAAARRETLAWLGNTFDLDVPKTLSGLGFGWVVLGVLALLGLLLCWNGLPPRLDAAETWRRAAGKLAAVSVAWATGLGIAAWVAPRVPSVPAREANVVLSIMGAELLMMGMVIAASYRRSAIGSMLRRPRLALADVGRGAAAGAMAQLALEAVFSSVYAAPLDWQRLVLFCMFMVLTAPVFLTTAIASQDFGGGHARIGRGMTVEIVLAALTAVLAARLFVRMAVLPVAVLSLVLLFVAAYRGGGRSTASAGAFGAVMYARAASVVCAFY